MYPVAVCLQGVGAAREPSTSTRRTDALSNAAEQDLANETTDALVRLAGRMRLRVARVIVLSTVANGVLPVAILIASGSVIGECGTFDEGATNAIAIAREAI